MLIHIDMVKIISYIDGIKGLHTNCRLASCFVSYVNEQQSDYHGIIWFTLFELLVLCVVNPLLTGGFPYRRSIVRNCVVWLMHFALLVERWCLIKGFHIAGPVCGVSICSNPHHKRNEGVMSSFMFHEFSTHLRLHCLFNSSFESLTGLIKYKEHRFNLRDKEITCDHGCAELDFKHGR